MKSLSLIPWMLLEKLINELLARDPGSLQRRQKLVGKSLRFDIKELPFELTVSIDEYGLRLTTVSEGETDCWLQTELGVLPELSDSSNLTRLIKAGKLDIEGDPMLAQQLVALIKELDIDWEEHLAEHTNDVLAHEVFSAGKRMHNTLLTFTRKLSRTVGNAVVEEKQLAAHRLAVMHFNDEVSELRDDVARAEVRLQKLEEQANKN